MKLNPNTVIPLHSDKYYVYALFKPCDYNPFYIGKGIDSRINTHFRDCNLKINTPKTGVIKKYGNKIKREILCYFDTESSAYVFEEYLISLYGLKSEGGHLVNYAKTRFEYSGEFVKNISSVGHLSRKRKYDKQVIQDALNRFYFLGQTTDVISSLTSIPENYLGYVLRGKKCKGDYLEFMDANPDLLLKSKKILESLITKRRSVSHSNTEKDEMIRKLFNLVCSGSITVREAAKQLDMAETYLSEVFLGKSRPYLNLEYTRYCSRRTSPKAIDSLKRIGKIKSMIESGIPHTDIIKNLGIGRTTFYRALKSMINSDNSA